MVSFANRHWQCECKYNNKIRTSISFLSNKYDIMSRCMIIYGMYVYRLIQRAGMIWNFSGMPIKTGSMWLFGVIHLVLFLFYVINLETRTLVTGAILYMQTIECDRLGQAHIHTVRISAWCITKLAKAVADFSACRPIARIYARIYTYIHKYIHIIWMWEQKHKKCKRLIGRRRRVQYCANVIISIL